MVPEKETLGRGRTKTQLEIRQWILQKPGVAQNMKWNLSGYEREIDGITRDKIGIKNHCKYELVLKVPQQKLDDLSMIRPILVGYIVLLK
jgi:hypothetical protein